MQGLWRFIKALSLPLSVFKVIFTVAMIVGTIVTYTAYKTKAPTTQLVIEGVRSDFSGSDIRRSSSEGQKIIALYQQATTTPNPIVVESLYASALSALGSEVESIRVPETSVLLTPAAHQSAYEKVVQLKFVSQPLLSGTSLGVSLLAGFYLVALLLKGLVRLFKPRNRAPKPQVGDGA